MNTLWTDAPYNVLFLIGQVRKMSKKVREIVSPTIQRGSYCCHSETILQALLCSKNEEDRRFAVKQIREIRESLGHPDIGDGGFRERITPKLDFEATTLQDLIEWEDVLNEPVLTTEIPTGKYFKVRDKLTHSVRLLKCVFDNVLLELGGLSCISIFSPPTWS